MRGPQRRREEGWIGQTLDRRYRIQEVFSETATHTVFVAEHLRLRKQVAIKIIQPEYASDGEVAARFAREATAGAQFDHPNVVGIIDCGRLDDGRTYLVTELVRGPTIREFLGEHGPLPWKLVCEIGSQLTEALIAAHGVGIVHRDVNPDNLVLEIRDDGTHWIKLTSFGIARMTGNALVDPSHELGSTLTRQGSILGTAGYMSPEQAIGEDVDPAADAYALAAVLWECVQGRQLWRAATIEDALALQLHQEPPRLQGIGSGSGPEPVPETLETVLRQLLARDPRQRPSLIEVVSPTLRRLAHGADFEESSVSGIPEGVESAHAPELAAAAGGTVVVDHGALPAIGGGSSSLRAILRQLVEVVQALWRGASRRTRAILVGLSLLPVLVLALVVAVVSSGGREEEPDSAGVTPDREAEAKDEVEAKDEAAAQGEAEGSTAARPEPELPAELRAAIGLLFDPEVSEKERALGATKVSEHEEAEGVPTHTRAAAQLVLAKKCSEKQAILRAIRELDAPETLPVLLALDQSGRKACGKGKRKTDCYACLREDLARMIGRFEVLAERQGAPGASSRE